MLSRLDTITDRDGWTDGQTDRRTDRIGSLSVSRVSIDVLTKTL